jgi:AcrR family transcriptional regulator
MIETNCESLDPRVRRTRQLLQDALAKLLGKKDFEKISVQDIADEATVNRATFYDHFDDKFALLESMVGARFNELLARRGVRFDGTCAGALKGMVLGVCDFLLESLGKCGDRQRQMEAHLESAVVSVVRQIILEGLKGHSGEGGASPELIASMASGAIFGAAKEWIRTPHRCSSDEIVETVKALVNPILASAHRAAKLGS